MNIIIGQFADFASLKSLQMFETSQFIQKKAR